jgi:hypothetical protein
MRFRYPNYSLSSVLQAFLELDEFHDENAQRTISYTTKNGERKSMNGVIDMVPNLILYVFILTHVLWR